MPAMRMLFPFSVLLFFASASRADEEANPPCQPEYKAALDATGSPKFAEAQKQLDDCTALFMQQQEIAEQKKHAEFAVTGHTWAATLDRLPEGGWTFVMVSDEGTYAVFGTRRHAIRTGDVVTVWLRFEYREPQTNSGERYKSQVERKVYDCARMASKTVSDTRYAENNLTGVGASDTYDESKISWTPAIPGTVGDFLIDWACKSVPRAQPAKP
jgi:hypothetical protein